MSILNLVLNNLILLDNAGILLDLIVLETLLEELLILDAEDPEAVASPVRCTVGEDNDETDERDDVGDTSAGGVGNGTLDRREDSSTRDTHDEDTGTATSVTTEVGSSESEDGGVHWGLEEEKTDEDTGGRLAVATADIASESNSADSVDSEDEVGFEDSGKSGSEEASDGEGDESVGQHVGSLSGSVRSALGEVVDEEGSDSDLGTDVAELGDETEDHVVLLVDRTLGVGLDNSLLVDGTGSGFCNFRKLAEDVENSDSNTGAGNGEVDVLYIGQAVLILAREEELGSDEGANEGGDTVPRLAELQTGRGGRGRTDDDGVGVGGSLESGKTAGDDESADAEATERSRCLCWGGELGSRPEEDGAERVEEETHKDGDLVTLALHDLSSNGRVEEVTATEVHDLQTGGLELRDTKDSLEMLVQDIEKAVRETPEEEERGDEGDGVDELAASEVAALDSGSNGGDTAASHGD